MTDLNTTVIDDKLHWYKDAIIYELHIKAFKDGNGDGIGDFEGLIQQLDYLQDLGVNAIWVLPFYPSPLRDDGYDIADYYSINPSYGNIEQFKTFLNEAHERNLKVITELVINHTSDQHPWFQRARRSPIGSPERDYYVWTDDPTRYKEVRIIFQDFEASNWTWDPVAGQYFWHRFFNHQPDLNYDNPLVQQEVFKIIDYWCAMGVDGFRLDAVPYLYERENTNCENLPETHDYLKKLRAHVDQKYPGTVLLAEANMWPEDSASYFGNGDECQMNYNFPVMPRMFMSLQMEDRYPITDIFDQTPAIPETCQWAIFLRNHDELTLEMVTDEERDYMYKAYAKDPKAKINLGIRHRLAPLMENNRKKIELMNVLLFSLAGTPVIYYGDEIGMGDNFYLGDRDGVRTPMQWSSDRNGGFSLANPQKLYLPLILDAAYNFDSLNVDEQNRNPSSLLWFMKHLINIRKKYRAFSRGDLAFLNIDNPKVLVFTRTWQDQTILVLVNFSRYAQPAEVDLSSYKGSTPVDIYSKNKFPVIKETPYFFTPGPYACYWFELKKVSTEVTDHSQLPVILLDHLYDLLKNNKREQFENEIAGNYLAGTRWFTGLGRAVYNIQVKDFFKISMAPYDTLLLLLEITYESGLPETYQLPVSLIKILNGNEPPEAAASICRVKMGTDELLLVDAFYLAAYHQVLFTNLLQSNIIKQGNKSLVYTTEPILTKQLIQNTDLKSKVLPVEDFNTSIGINNSYFIKMYRQVEQSVNADVELTTYLTKQANFAAVPEVLGTIEWQSEKQNAMVLGMLQPMVEYHGNGRTYMFERLNEFHEQIVARQLSASTQITTKLTQPISFDGLPEELKEFIGFTVADGAGLLGTRTGEMHVALASGPGLTDFKPEDFSLHYQRSLFSGLQSLVRAAFQNLSKKIDSLPQQAREEAKILLGKKDEILKILKQIYSKKMDVTRIRIHGNYQLRRVLFTGKDIAILDFGGDPTRSYSERRIKRSALRDVAGMIRSFYYAAYEGLILDKKLRPEDIIKHEPYADLWIHQVSGYFLHAYLQTVKDASFIPPDKKDFEVLLQTFLLEKAVYSLYYELNHRPEYVIVPLRLIRTLIS
ncbi:MAG: maltose alpha-D-glucosyltransferase [Chitinophagaceae bacterium]|nr:maltose alpha-D-glucosyltransferase [Chitinophagaceae bacterium]